MSLSQEERKEFWAALALRHTKGLGPRTWKRLLAAYGGALPALQAAGQWNARDLARQPLAEAVQSGQWRPAALEEWEAVRGLGCGVLLYTSPLYPQRLREIPDPPLYLYAQGDASLLRTPGVGVVGTRRSTAYGREAAKTLCSELSQSGVTIISGLAYGIDRQAHLSGLEHAGSSIAVLGAGLDVDYPAGNADVRRLLRGKGLVLTEYPPGACPEPRNFPVRNRIISGLSLVEASEKSGSMITARQAMEQGREVFAVPGPMGSANYMGCFWLINQGAKLVCSAEEVLRELGPQLAAWRHGAGPAMPVAGVPNQATPPALARKPGNDAAVAARPSPPTPTDLDPEERSVLAALSAEATLHIDSLGERLGWEAGRVSRALLLLEMRGLVRQLPGMVYGVV